MHRVFYPFAVCFAFWASQSFALETLATLDSRLLREASGMEVISSHEDMLWFVNDSGNDAALIALDYKTGTYNTLAVEGAKNRDWEDMAAFSYGDVPWLAIADVGDNAGKRDQVFIYLFPEPNPQAASVRVHTRLSITYPKGARDVESVAIDSNSNSIYLLSKREKSPRLYRAPLPDLSEAIKKKPFKVKAQAARLGKIRTLPKPSPLDLFSMLNKYAAQPTSMTMLPDSSAIAILTYGAIYLAMLSNDGDWYKALEAPVCRVAQLDLEQAETIAADSSGRLYVTSEGRGVPLLRMPAVCEDNRES